MTRWARLGSIVLATLAVLAAPSIASAQTSGLEFVAPEELAFTGSDDATVWLQNNSGSAVDPSFTMSAEDSDGNEIPKDSVSVVVTDKIEQLGPYSVGRYRLHLEGSAIEKDLSGELVATAVAAARPESNEPTVAPASLSVSAGPKSDFDHGVGEILYIPAIAAFLLVLISWIATILGGWVSPLTALPALDFDFKTSFASTLTTVGALLATIIAAGVLPEETVNLSKESFTALNLLFAVAVVAAGLVYSALQTSRWVPMEGEATKEIRKPQGHFIALLLASLITVWAVFGELWTMGLLVDELGQDQGFSAVAVDIFKGLLIVSVLAMCIYTPVRIRATVKSERTKSPPAVKAASPTPAIPSQTPPAVAHAESVSLL